MKKRIFTILLIINFIIGMSCVVFAGEWRQDNNGWWWCNDDRSYPVNCWQWIDDNNDGVAECYYFNQSGYCLMGTKTPDGYYVNPNGAWIVNGAIQKKTVVTYSSPNGLPYSNSNNYVKETEKVDLASLQVISKSYSNIVDSGETMLDGLFGKCIIFRNSVGHRSMYIEFYLGYNYSKLTFTYAPKKGMGEDNAGIIYIYGDDIENDLLFESDEINYRSHSKTDEIDVSGCEFIRIKYGCNTSWDDGNVLVKGFVK